MFEKILIANRGEIAVRLILTCKKLGVRAVAVFSEPDTRSPHVALADESELIGPAPAAESYLNMEKIIAAAKKHGCAAIHPGYGFLSENPEFAEKVPAAGLVFIGPPARVIALMGDKLAAKKLAESAGVPVLPGGLDRLSGPDAARVAAGKIGYPVLLKPAAGGGGRGLRVIAGPEDLDSAFLSAQAETRKAFGDDRLFLEKYISRPRHLEVQVLADRKGRVVAFPERECSIQRRHQKILEESPSPGADEDLRRRLREAARRLAEKAGYESAGTVEFLLDPEGNFYFLEMNTRLQVEHPVTEMVTGLDLVELQLRIAAGEDLKLEPEALSARGWAIEARVCAEDPHRHFLPSTGLVTRYAEPRGKNIRVDSGVRAGSQVVVYYDSLLAKVICHGETRAAAIELLTDALNGYHLEGLATNVAYLNAVIAHPAFQRAELSTDFVPRFMDDPQERPTPPVRNLHALVLAAVLVFHNRQNQVRVSLEPMATRVGAVPKPVREYRYMARSGEENFEIRLSGDQKTRNWTAQVNGQTYKVATPEFEFYRRRLKLSIDGRPCRFLLRADDNHFRMVYSGLERELEIYNPREWEAMQFMPRPRPPVIANLLASPMPGIVIEVRVKPGDRVWRGEALVILESMKMESEVASPCDGEVEAVLAVPGQTVESGDALVKFASS